MNLTYRSLVRVLNASGCPVENNRPPVIQQNPDANGAYAGIKPAMQQAARAAFDATRANPQLIIIVLPVILPTVVTLTV